MMAWKMGLKTTYYLRTLGATAIEKSTASSAALADTLGVVSSVASLEAVGVSAGTSESTPSATPESPTFSATVPPVVAEKVEQPAKVYSEAEKVMCSIMNGGACEACQ